jgi:hypothetical protein
MSFEISGVFLNQNLQEFVTFIVYTGTYCILFGKTRAFIEQRVKLLLNKELNQSQKIEEKLIEEIDKWALFN